jgi:hypothetical protein
LFLNLSHFKSQKRYDEKFSLQMSSKQSVKTATKAKNFAELPTPISENQRMFLTYTVKRLPVQANTRFFYKPAGEQTIYC